MLTKQSVTKNAVYFLGSTVAQKAMTFLYFILVARSFGPLEQGRYSTAIAFATFFGVFIDIGLSSALTRESSRVSREEISKYAGQMLLLRFTLGILVYGGMIGAAYLFGLSHELIQLIFVTGCAALIDVVATSFWAIIRGLQNLRYEALGGIIANGTMIVFGGGAMLFHMPITALVVALFLGSLANLAYVVYVITRNAHIRFSLRPQIAILKKLLMLCAPFAGAAIFSRIYTFTDTTLVARLAGEQFAGYYAAGSKLVLALNMIPAALAASLYPAMSAHFVSTQEHIGKLLEKSLQYLALIALPLAVSIATVAPYLVPLFYGESYDQTITVVQYIMPGLVFSFLIFPLGSVIAATNRQKLNTMIMGVAAGLNILLNILLIPMYAHLGAAVTFSVTYGTIFVFSLMATHEYWKDSSARVALSLVKICVSALCMALSILVLTQFIPDVIAIILGCLVYLIMIYITRSLTREMIDEVKHRFRHS
ncbi:flippase [Candidatus Uhrbacteria bacterium]|nr:flippase [Candidatus Uhrbacteria bacterium]